MIPPDEYAERLYEAMRRIRKKLRNLSIEESFSVHHAEDKRDEEEYLKHHFNGVALMLATDAITLSPHQVKERVIRRRNFRKRRK